MPPAGPLLPGAWAPPLAQGALALAALAWVAQQGSAALPAAAALVVAAAAALAVFADRRAREAEQARRTLAAQAGRTRELLDALPLGVVLYDVEDRLVQCNRSFRELYASMAPLLVPGIGFEQMLRQAVERDLIPEARGREASWIEERVWQHRQCGTGVVREMPDGRWRRIVEHRLSDGGILSYSTDVTELMQRERALEAARREADLARTRLRDAIEALPAGFELYDAQDRLVLTNARMRRMYPLVAHLLDTQPTFEALVRANHAAGGLPARQHNFEEWLAKRLAGRRQPHEPQLSFLVGGRWQRIYEHRTSEGGLVGVRVDVTEWVEGGAEWLRLNREVAEARAALAASGVPASRPSVPAGLHLTSDLSGCDGALALMRNPDALRALALRLVAEAGLRCVGDRFHHFEGNGGVTGTVLLAESHLALHTWPEDAAVTLDVFVCNRGGDGSLRAQAVMNALEAAFAPRHVERHTLVRCGAA
ncbi:MAG: adenosylmethionine decarboxylase [Rubrivivax sp.]